MKVLYSNGEKAAVSSLIEGELVGNKIKAQSLAVALALDG